MHCARNQTVHIADREHHRADDDDIFELFERLGRRQALGLAQRHHGIDIVDADGVGIQYFQAGRQGDALGGRDHLNGFTLA